MINDTSMRTEALRQAKDRRDRTGDTITVYRSKVQSPTGGLVWYVRDDAEGRPDGTEIIAIILGKDD